jgi:hypothetical protein
MRVAIVALTLGKRLAKLAGHSEVPTCARFVRKSVSKIHL